MVGTGGANNMNLFGSTGDLVLNTTWANLQDVNHSSDGPVLNRTITEWYSLRRLKHVGIHTLHKYLMLYLPGRESREVQMSSGVCQSTTRLFLRFKKDVKNKTGQTRWCAQLQGQPSWYEDPNKETYRPAWKSPHLPFFLKVRQHFAVQLVLVQQRFDPVRVVLQVLQQHLQIPAPAPDNIPY